MLWNATYETGVAVMDEQHKELFRQVDVLLDQSKADRIHSTLDFLASYVVHHFTTEEKMQARTNYPNAVAHKQTLVDFINSYKNLKSEYDKSGGNPIHLMKLSQAALAWLKNHIRVEDREFAKFYLASSAGKTMVQR